MAPEHDHPSERSSKTFGKGRSSSEPDDKLPAAPLGETTCSAAKAAPRATDGFCGEKGEPAKCFERWVLKALIAAGTDDKYNLATLSPQQYEEWRTRMLKPDAQARERDQDVRTFPRASTVRYLVPPGAHGSIGGFKGAVDKACAANESGEYEKWP